MSVDLSWEAHKEDVFDVVADFDPPESIQYAFQAGYLAAEDEHARLREAIAAHLDIISGKITGGIASPTLVLVSALDLRRLIGKE